VELYGCLFNTWNLRKIKRSWQRTGIFLVQNWNELNGNRGTMYMWRTGGTTYLAFSHRYSPPLHCIYHGVQSSSKSCQLPWCSKPTKHATQACRLLASLRRFIAGRGQEFSRAAQASDPSLPASPAPVSSPDLTSLYYYQNQSSIFYLTNITFS
jgi:hypothetical protein